MGGFLGVLGLALQIGGGILSYIGKKKQGEAQKDQIAAFQEAEEARKKQMELDALRKRRELVRQGIVARSQALTAATAQGAAFGSGLQGGFAQLFSQEARGKLEVGQNLQLGEDVFAANKKGSQAQIREIDAGGLVNIGSGLFSLGGALINNSGTIGKIGTRFSGSN